MNGTTKESISNTSSTATNLTYNTYSNRKGIICGGSTYSADATTFIQNININTFELTATNGVSISIWIYPTDISPFNSILTSFANNVQDSSWLGGGFLLKVSSSSIYYTYANYANGGYAGSCYKTGLTISNNNWYHIVVTFNGVNKSGQIYLNNIGQSVTSETDQQGEVSALNISTSTNILSIGTSNAISSFAGYSGENYPNFTGVISKFGIYNKVLTSAEVNSLYNA